MLCFHIVAVLLCLTIASPSSPDMLAISPALACCPRIADPSTCVVAMQFEVEQNSPQ